MPKAPYCLNSRRWLDFVFFNNIASCPYKGWRECGPWCEYYTLKEKNEYYREKAKILFDGKEPSDYEDIFRRRISNGSI